MSRTQRFIERVFTEAERDYCNSRGAVSAQHYAARFAAKEAMLKALGTGWRGGIGWRDVEIATRASGAPYLIMHGSVLELFQTSGANTSHLSLSHTSQHAIAQVILEQR